MWHKKYTLRKSNVFFEKINVRISNFWELIAYKNMLDELSSGIQKNIIGSGGLNKSQMEELSDKIKKLSDAVNLKNYGY